MGAAALSPDMLTCQNGWNYNGLPPSCNDLYQFSALPAIFLYPPDLSAKKKYCDVTIIQPVRAVKIETQIHTNYT